MAILSPRPSSSPLALIGSVTWLQSVKFQEAKTEAERQRRKDRNRIVKGGLYVSVANGSQPFEKIASPFTIQLPTSNECWNAISTIVDIFSIVMPLVLAPLGAIDEVSKSLWS